MAFASSKLAEISSALHDDSSEAVHRFTAHIWSLVHCVFHSHCASAVQAPDVGYWHERSTHDCAVASH
ncbi:hypothetical protein DIPPA_08812 [Diplonema papillatum]|nr:hypothetical protein DIPPA_08812 [Diplonema papillatum]